MPVHSNVNSIIKIISFSIILSYYLYHNIKKGKNIYISTLINFSGIKVMESSHSTDDVIKEARGLKESWYSLLGILESLANFEKASDMSFRQVLRRSSIQAKPIEEKLNSLSFAFKRYNPELRDEIDQRIMPLSSGIVELESALQNEIANHMQYIKINEAISEIEKELEEVEKEKKGVEPKVGLICGKFFQRKNEYKISIERIKTSLRKELGWLETNFINRAGKIVEGCVILRDDEEIEVIELFSIIVREPSAINSIHLREKNPRKRFFGIIMAENIEPEEKVAVLKYLCEEIGKKSRNIKERGKARAEEVRVEFADLDSIEKACSDIDNRRKETEGYALELREKIAKLEEEKPGDYENYNLILKIKSNLSDILSNGDIALQELIDFIEKNMAGVELETNPEKRMLKLKIKELENQVNYLKSRVPTLTDELEKAYNENMKLKGNLGEVTSELQKIKPERSSLEETLNNIKEEYSLYREKKGTEIEELHIEKKKIEEQMKKLMENFETYRNESQVEINRLKEKIRKLEEEKSNLTDEINSNNNRILELERKINEIKEKLKINIEELLKGVED